MDATPQQKTKEQKAKENAFLSHVTLCVHNLTFACNPPNGKPCNYAHWLKDLQTPEESAGDWSKVWGEGKVDIRFWQEYRPNPASLRRFTAQFEWERRWFPYGIPGWAWGHAVELGLLKETEVPNHVPRHYDWPELQSLWEERKRRGQRTAASSWEFRPEVTRRQEGLMAAWRASWWEE